MDTKPEGLSVNGAGIKFRSLSLSGVRGKVRATLSENQVSFESKNGHALDIRLDAIQRVHHHHTTLVPGWLAVVGLIFMWVAWRGVTGKFQAVLGAAGIVMATSHYLTRRPTLTIDTKAKDCHTVFGPDLSMMRLCALIQRIQNGMNLEDAKQSVDNMVSDSEYPRSLNSEEIELLPEPVELFPSPVIGHFMDTMTIDEPLIEIDEIPSPAVVIDDLDLPSIWDEEEESIEQVMPDGLLQRSRENLITRRNNISASGWQPPTHQEQFNQVLRGSPDGGNSYGMIQQHSMQNHSHNSMPQLTPAPTEFLPSFVGAQGAHLPSNPHVFNSPDSPLPNQEPEEEKQSLVASSRRDVPIDAEIIPDEKLKLEEIHFDKNEWTNILPDNFDINKSLSYKSNGETIYFNVTSFTLDDNENKSTARDHRIRKNNTIMWEEFHNKYADAEEEKKKKSDTPQTSERGRSRPRDRGDPKLLFPDSIQ